MFIIGLLFIVWATDVFLLRDRWKNFFGRGPGIAEVFTFICSALLAVLFDIVSLRVFSVGLFTMLSVYVWNRMKCEQAGCRAAYYEEDPRQLKNFLALMVVGIFLKWVWGILLISAGIQAMSAGWNVPGSRIGEASFLSLMAGLWMLFLIYDFSRKAPVWPLKDLLGFSAIRPSRFWNYGVPVAGGIVVAVLSATALFYRRVQPVTPFSELMDWADMSAGVMIFLMVAVLLAPVIEELIFRGFFFRVVAFYRNPAWAFWVIALSFGFLHMEQYWGDWAGIIAVFTMGILLTWLRIITNGVKAPVVLHYVFNGLMVALPVIFFITQNPSLAEYYVHQKSLDFSRKEDLLKENISRQPYETRAYYELAWLYLDHDLLADAALDLMDRALTLSPGRSIFLYTRAEALYRMGDRAQALEILTGLIETVPDNQEIKQRFQEMQDE